MINLLDLIGRILISSLFLFSAFSKLLNINGTMGWMEGYGVPGFLVYPALLIEIILPILVIIGYNAKVSSGILASFCLVTAFVFHFDFSDQMQLISFLKNIGLAGGFLFILVNGTKDWSVEKKKKYVRL